MAWSEGKKGMMVEVSDEVGSRSREERKEKRGGKEKNVEKGKEGREEKGEKEKEERSP